MLGPFLTCIFKMSLWFGVWVIVHFMINLELPFTLYNEQGDVFLNREVFISYALERDI